MSVLNVTEQITDNDAVRSATLEKATVQINI